MKESNPRRIRGGSAADPRTLKIKCSLDMLVFFIHNLIFIVFWLLCAPFIDLDREQRNLLIRAMHGSGFISIEGTVHKFSKTSR